MNRFTILLAGLTALQLQAANAGFYAGANFGANSVSVNKTLYYPLGSNTYLTANRYDAAYTGFHAQLLAGDSFQYNDKWSLAIEGDLEWFTSSSQHKIDNFFFSISSNAEERLGFGLGLYLLPEFQFNQNSKLFLGPGVSTTRFNVGLKHATAGNEGVTGDYSNWLGSYGFKAGMKSSLNEKIDLVLTYQFNQFNRIQKTNIEPLSNEVLTGYYKPYANTFMVGLRYNA